MARLIQNLNGPPRCGKHRRNENRSINRKNQIRRVAFVISVMQALECLAIRTVLSSIPGSYGSEARLFFWESDEPKTLKVATGYVMGGLDYAWRRATHGLIERISQLRLQL